MRCHGENLHAQRGHSNRSINTTKVPQTRFESASKNNHSTNKTSQTYAIKQCASRLRRKRAEKLQGIPSKPRQPGKDRRIPGFHFCAPNKGTAQKKVASSIYSLMNQFGLGTRLFLALLLQRLCVSSTRQLVQNEYAFFACKLRSQSADQLTH